MTYSWTVKSKGKFERILILYSSLLAILAAIYLYTTWVADASVTFLQFLMASAIFWLPMAIIALLRIIRTQIPKSIVVDEAMGSLAIVYSPSKTIIIPFDNLGIAVGINRTSHVSLGLYKTFVGSRGQLIFNQETELLGMKYSLAWKYDDVFDIVQRLEELGIPKTTATNRDLPLWERVMSA